MSERGSSELKKQKLLEIKGTEELKFCENCVLEKSKRIKSSAASHTTQDVLGYIYSDLWGPAKNSKRHTTAE